MLQKVEIELEVPEGYRVLRYGRPARGDLYLTHSSKGVYVELAEMNFQHTCYFILEKIVEYRHPVMPDDWGVKCEFSNDRTTWYPSVLRGFRPHCNEQPFVTNTKLYAYARIKVEN